MDIGGRIALVTGGAVRIGRAVCLRLAAEGATVVIHCNRSKDKGEALRAEIQDAGDRAYVITADLSRAPACEGLIEETVKTAGGLDILINNAAVFHKDALDEISQEVLMREWQVNLMAPILLAKTFITSAKSGKVVNLLDRRIFSHDPECIPYLLSKMALAEFTKSAALAAAPGFTVNGVAPGAILPPPGKGEEYLKDAAGEVPLKRQCTPEDVADAVIFCLRNDALTGAIIPVDGGQHLL